MNEEVNLSVKKDHLNLQVAPLHEWCMTQEKPLIISGPCSAENQKQVVNTAKEIAKIGSVDIFRAGVWKPRTRPSPFEGVGEQGLQWLNEAKQETGLQVTTEVANAYHVELCLKYNIDILWIGARTVANPFSVTEIASALQGVDIPVMIKNPVNPDLQLWIGALERINNAGIRKIIAIHRGFSSYAKSPFRNSPKWELPIELKSLCPDLKIICDPSHIAGDRELIPMISQKALDLDMSGLMIECHIHPENALSDSQQQVSIRGLTQILNNLIIRRSMVLNDQFKNKLDQLRNSIDEMDEKLIQILASRMEVTDKIGEYKRDNDVTILQVNRWNEIRKNRLNMGEVLGLDREFLDTVLHLIHKESISRQTAIMNKVNGSSL